MYEYQKEREKLFTEDGLKLLLKIRDKVKELLTEAGAFTMEKAISGQGGSSWMCLACIDYLVEKEEIREVTALGSCAGQNRIFTA